MKLLLVWLLAMANLVEAYAWEGSERQEERCIVALEVLHTAYIDCAVLDTRAGFGDFDRPRHVWRYSDEAVGVGATPEHPFFSVDRQAYIAAGELHPGEEVMTAGEKVVKFLSGKLRDKGEPVYNIEVWREHNYYVGSKGSGEFLLVHNNYVCLKGLKDLYSDIIGQTGIDHIFKGAINKSGKATGVHHIRAIKSGTAKIVAGSKQDVGPPGFYKAKVQVKHGNTFVDKVDNNGYSTFFPDNWDEVKTMDKIKEAANNKIDDLYQDAKVYTFIGQTSEGIKIRITIWKKYDNIYSAFPDY
jgi:hypothetical protein